MSSKTTLEKESAFQRIAAFDQKSLLPSQEETGKRNGARVLGERLFPAQQGQKMDLGDRQALKSQPWGIASETLESAGSKS